MKSKELSCKDLMVDDWVHNTHNQCNERVQEIGAGKVMLDYNDLYGYDEIESIPVTAEILEKNGFVWNGLPFVLSWEGFGLALYVGGDGYIVNCGANASFTVSYVHQLQHVLRLCGIEKEIDL
jgi:hypothetical protein